MIRAYVELLNIPIDDYGIGHLAYHIEREICNQQGGKQDQYSSTFGGFNFMEFFADNRTLVTPLRIRQKVISELETCLVLYYTGISRDSSSIIKDQSKCVEQKSDAALKSMHEIKSETIEMKECLLRGDFDRLVKSIRNGWENKKEPQTLCLTLILMKFMKQQCKLKMAGKVSVLEVVLCTFMFLKRMLVLDSFKLWRIYNNCHFTNKGSYSWKISREFYPHHRTTST